MAKAKSFLGYSAALLLPVSVVGYATYGQDWYVTKSETGSITGIEIGPSTTTETASEPEATPNITSNADLLSELGKIARSDSWCSSEKISYDNVSYPFLHLPEPAITPGNATEYSAQLCIDDKSVEVTNLNEVNLFMATHHPVIPQTEGNPSLFLTYKDPEKLDDCILAKEEMRGLVADDLERFMGATAANYKIKIHVDARNLNHPCDDSYSG